MRYDEEPDAKLEQYGDDAILRSMFGQSVLALGYRSAGAVVTFGFSVLFARIMPIGEYGVMVSLLPFGLIAATIGLLGQHTLLLRDIPKLLTQQNYQELTKVASRRLFLTLCASIAVTAVAACVFIAGHGRISIFSRLEYAVSVLLILPLALVEIQNSIGCALGSVHLAIGPKEVLWRLAVSIVGLALFVAGGRLLNAGTVLGISVVVIWLVVALQQNRVRQLVDWRPVFSWTALFDKTIAVNLSASVPFWITSVVNTTLPSVDIIIVSVFVGPETAAYYYAANRIALLLEFFISSFSIPASPCIAWLYEAGNRSQINRIVSNAALLSCAAVLVAVIVLGFTDDFVLRVFGAKFVQAHGFLMLLAGGVVGSAYLGLGTPALDMTGHQAAAMRIMAINAIVGIPIMIVATEIFGAWGTAAVAVFATLSRKGAMAAYLYAADGIDSTAGSAICEWLTVLSQKFRGAAAAIEG